MTTASARAVRAKASFSTVSTAAARMRMLGAMTASNRVPNAPRDSADGATVMLRMTMSELYQDYLMGDISRKQAYAALKEMGISDADASEILLDWEDEAAAD
jgi:hypothetical protein